MTQDTSEHDLGDGLLLLSPDKSRIDVLCNELRDGLIDRGATLEEMLAELRRLRQGRAKEGS